MIPDRTIPGGLPIGTADNTIDEAVRKVRLPGTNWVEMPPEEGLPKFALHVFGMPNTASRAWRIGGEAPCLITIRGDNKVELQEMANSYSAVGIWIDDELWPPHQIHHFGIQSLYEGPEFIETDEA